ncbi:MAG: BatD family protein, partial [Anaerolineales bacterium]|nr:BatD family protein [Anaerolineales bacterium]
LANPDQTAVDVNDALTLRVTVQGSGNMDTLPEPVWPEWDGWREFETTSSSSSRVENGRVVGQKTFEKVLIPLEAGERTLPALSYTYFDPATETYQTATTEPMAMSVVGAAPANQSAPVNGVASNTAVVGENVSESALASQIQPLKNVPTALQTSGTGTAATLLNAPLFWLMALLPALVLAGDWGWSAYQKRLAQDPVGLRRKRAKHTAVKRLKQAQQQNDSDTPALVAQALIAYLGDKLNQPTSGMTRPALAQTLREANVDAALIGRVQEILTLCEAARYAPQAHIELDLPAEAMTLIALLDAQQIPS